MDMGFRHLMLTHPTVTPDIHFLFIGSCSLLHASFRHSLTVVPLRFARPSPPSGWSGNFHPQVIGHGPARMKHPAASSGVSKKTQFERNCRVEAQSADTHRGGTMGIAESILSQAEGLNPSYAGIAAQQAAGN